jgi:hypothetical protein
MFRVDVETLEAYFAFDPKREADLRRLDALITKAAPCLKRYFHKGTPAGEPGMRFKMIRCHSASNRDPGRYRRKSLNKHGYCAHGWGPDWVPIKSPEIVYSKAILAS